MPPRRGQAGGPGGPHRGTAGAKRTWHSVVGMVAEGVDRLAERRTGKNARAEPPSWNVVLHNERNPINRVAWRLWQTIDGMAMKKATKVTWTAHTQGRAVAKMCHKELGELYEERPRAKGLIVSIEPSR